MNQIRISKGLSFYKKQSSVFMLIVAISFASNVKADDIAVTSVKSGAATGSAKCNYPGEENETNDEGVEIAGGAFAGSIELEVRNNKVTKLDSKIAGTSCRVSLGAFKQQIQPNTHNIVLKNLDYYYESAHE